MTSAEVQRLRAEVTSDRSAFLARVEELDGLVAVEGGDAVLAQMAVALHHAYGAIEAALLRVSRLLEGSAPQGANWHQQLLHVMTLEIPSVRPAVLSAEAAAGLRKLLAFRHFFRHAYAAAWDHVQLANLRTVALSLRAPLSRDLAALDALLVQLAALV